MAALKTSRHIFGIAASSIMPSSVFLLIVSNANGISVYPNVHSLFLLSMKNYRTSQYHPFFSFRFFSLSIDSIHVWKKKKRKGKERREKERKEKVRRGKEREKENEREKREEISSLECKSRFF